MTIRIISLLKKYSYGIKLLIYKGGFIYLCSYAVNDHYLLR